MIITHGETRTIPLVDIQMDETTQIRAMTYPDVVKSYRAAMIAYDGDQPRPVVLGFDPIKVYERQGPAGTKPVFIVVDGWHRVTAARSIGKTFIEADMIMMENPGSLDEMRWLAVVGNLTHGHKLTNAEKRDALKHYLKANQHRHPGPRGGRDKGPFKSLREIGRDLGGMHHETVQRYLARHAPNTLTAILEPDPSRNDEEPSEVINGEFSVDLARGRKAVEVMAEVSRLVRLIDSPEALRTIRTETDRLTAMLARRGA